MPFSIPQTNLTGQWQYFPPLPASVYGTGWVLFQNGNVDLQVFYGNVVSQAKPVVSSGIGAGQYVLNGSATNGIIQIAAQAAGGLVTVPAQTIQGQFYEPTLPSLIPVAAGTSSQVLSPFTQIADVTIATASGAITISNISQSFNHLWIVFMAASLDAADFDTITMNFNDDFAANYYQEYLFGDTVTPTAFMAGPVANGAIGQGPAATSPDQDVWTVGEVTIPNYTAAAAHGWVSTNYGPYNIGTNQRVEVIGGYHAVDAAVGRIDFQTQSGSNFKIGSRFTVYGLL